MMQNTVTIESILIFTIIQSHKSDTSNIKCLSLLERIIHLLFNSLLSFTISLLLLPLCLELPRLLFREDQNTTTEWSAAQEIIIHHGTNDGRKLIVPECAVMLVVLQSGTFITKSIFTIHQTTIGRFAYGQCHTPYIGNTCRFSRIDFDDTTMSAHESNLHAQTKNAAGEIKPI